MKRFIYGGLSILLILIIWTLYALKVDNPYILPGPIHVFDAFIKLIFQLSTYLTILTSLLRLIIALTISILLGIILGIVSGNYASIDDFFHPLVSTLRSIPIASVIVIVLILAGHELSLYIITFLMIFPIVHEASKQGIHHIPKSLKNAIALETSSKIKIMTSIQFPLILPYIRTAIFQSIGLGFKVIVMAEFIAQTDVGIGRALFNSSLSINYANVFAWTLIIVIIVIAIEQLLKQIKKAYD